MVVLFLAQNIEITKFFLIKTALLLQLLQLQIITIFGILVHKSVEIETVRWRSTLTDKT